MRADQHHSSTARRALIAVIVATVTFVIATDPAIARTSSTERRTPVSAFRRFTFELEVGLTMGDTGPITFSTEGRYVGPDAQDCAATASFGPGATLRHRAVVIRDSVWIDEGHGLEKARPRDFDWEAECPSSPEFWTHLPFGDATRGMHGTTEKRGDINVEHVDLTELADGAAKLGFAGDLPAEITVERASVWRSARHGVIVGLDFAVQGHSEAACRELLEQDVDDNAPSSCAMTIRLDVTRINDPDVTIKGGHTANRRVIQA